MMNLFSKGGYLLVARVKNNLLRDKGVGAITIIMEITQRETE